MVQAGAVALLIKRRGRERERERERERDTEAAPQESGGREEGSQAVLQKWKHKED